MLINDWYSAQLAAFASLQGSRVARWRGIEQALIDEGPDGSPRFEHPSAPFIQLFRLELDGPDLGSGMSIGIYQFDDVWGLGVKENRVEYDDDDEWNGIYRIWSPTLPLGVIDRIDIRLEEGVISELLLRIDGSDLLLVAGEAYETSADSFDLHRLDESVLVFTDPSAATKLDWIPPRHPGLADVG
jgi:hypothetical protein